MKRILLVVSLSAILTAAFADFAEYKKIAIGALHGTAADTTLLTTWFYGWDTYMIAVQADTTVDSSAIVKIQLDLGATDGAYLATIGVATSGDTLVLNHEGSTKALADTFDLPSKGRLGFYPLARLRVIGQDASYAAKNCTLWLYRGKF